MGIIARFRQMNGADWNDLDRVPLQTGAKIITDSHEYHNSHEETENNFITQWTSVVVIAQISCSLVFGSILT